MHADVALAFLRIWFLGVYRPGRAVEQLRSQPAPHVGLVATLLRGGLVALLWFLLSHWLNRQPDPPSWISLFPTETCYLTLAWLFLLFTLALWLLGGAVTHLLLRLLGRLSSLDLLLNIGGMGALVATLPLLLCDWLNLLLGYPLAPVAWGIVHLLIDAWYWVFVAAAYRRLLGLPLGLSLALIGLGFAYGVPLAMLFIRG